MDQEESTKCLESKDINGDSLLQIKDGRILAYFFRNNRHLTIYDEKSLNEIFNIDLQKSIEKEKMMKKMESLEVIEGNSKYKWLKWNREEIPIYQKCTVKELSNGLILVGASQYLIELKLYEKTYDFNIIKKFINPILDINELIDKRIIIITSEYINVLNSDNSEYNIINSYLIKQNWKIEPVSSTRRFYGNFNQYFASYELPNNRLLLNSFSTELSYHGGCGTHPPEEFSHSKIIFIDLKHFEKIKSTDEFKVHVKNIILDKIIIIQDYEYIFVYDINSLDIINQIKFNKSYDYIFKYDNQTLIALSEYEKNNNLLIYKVDNNNNLIESCEIKTKFNFQEKIGWNGYSIREFNNKTFFKLNDKRVIMICHRVMYILPLEID